MAALQRADLTNLLPCPHTHWRHELQHCCQKSFPKPHEDNWHTQCHRVQGLAVALGCSHQGKGSLHPPTGEGLCTAEGRGSAPAINCTELLCKTRHLHGIKMDRPATILSRWISSRLVCINILISVLILPLSLQSVIKLCFSQKIIHDVYS